jgi:hypothetical protein
LLRVCVGVCVFRAHVQVGRRRYVSIRQLTLAYVSIREACVCVFRAHVQVGRRRRKPDVC